ncbi:ATP synthase F1 subcomplex delta subunit [Desulfonispora thiosulfatigenes DSM 11270]|uniref:ATP synthase subunit delta n=1 Tax=Desulfonispora thiosulfatigenes DSM 11270 TaxID=656914 RepID=A0A1W1V4D0_DESTI|nr:F0F1 ATP synthase subunit delta [Desulfonispora thiosulfatigenes]SMB88212.1 ATP synthase F1 subcomplex delta subunit [Desulfonispora thiosulfatigenes DSM 11270]
MKNKAVARRYAQALFEIAQEKEAIDLYEEELKFIIEEIKNSKNLELTWVNKEIVTDEKRNIFKEIFGDKVSEIILNTLFVLIDKHRELILEGILEVYQQYADESRNIQDAEVSSAVQLTDKDFNELTEKLSAMTGKNIRLTVKVDPSIIGGLVVRIGDKVIDGSVVKRLSVMKKRMKNAQFSRIGVRD